MNRQPEVELERSGNSVGSFEKNGTTTDDVREKYDGRSTISGIDPRYVVPGINID